MFAYIALGVIALYIAVRFLLQHRLSKRTPSTEDIDRELLANLNQGRDSHA
jgi:hypothetical protein